MLDDKQQTATVDGLTSADVVICLQIIQRLTNMGNGALQDQELHAVGTARNNLVAAMERATGVNYDVARAAQARALQEAQAKQRAMAQAASQAKAKAEAEKTEEAPSPDDDDNKPDVTDGTGE